MKKAVILLSGGLDSATCLAIAKSEGYDCHTLGFDYGQRHSLELECAKKLSPNHKILKIDNFGGSALTDKNIAVPKSGVGKEIPVTYVPARNIIFLSYALSYAEVLGANDIFIGVNALDYSGYPDCRPEFISAFEVAANLGTKAGDFKIHTPLISLTKAEIIKLGTSLGVNYALTSSCYDPTPQGKPCGTCDSCRLRLKGFQEANLRDPLS